MIHNTNVTGADSSGARGRKRTYESQLRVEQAEATRERILEALVRAMADGLATLSVPAVAREAGVSVPTVYRHFGSKAGLFDALGPYVTAKAGLVPETLPETLEEYADLTRTVFRNFDSMDATLRAALASELGREVRQAGMPWRRGIHREAIRRIAPELPDEEIERPHRRRGVHLEWTDERPRRGAAHCRRGARFQFQRRRQADSRSDLYLGRAW